MSTNCKYSCEFLALDKELNDDFKERKAFGRYLSRSYKRLGFSDKSEKVNDCGAFLDFGHNPDGSFKLANAYFCKNRLCPMCSWRRTKKVFSQVMQIMDIIKDDYQFIFLTLTVPNVPAEMLQTKLNQMQNAFRKYIRRKLIKRVCMGYFKTLEITYNRQRDDYHPHYHVIIAVPKNYFVSELYLNQSQWLLLWQQSMQDFSITQVKVEKCYLKRDDGSIDKNVSGVDLVKAVCEVSKYSVKCKDYIFTDNPLLTDKVTFTFDSVLFNRRLCSFGGCFSDVRDRLGLDDVTDGDLLHTDDNNDVKDYDSIYKVRWDWKEFRFVLYAIVYPDVTLLTDFRCSVMWDSLTGEVLIE